MTIPLKYILIDHYYFFLLKKSCHKLTKFISNIVFDLSLIINLGEHRENEKKSESNKNNQVVCFIIF